MLSDRWFPFYNTIINSNDRKTFFFFSWGSLENSQDVTIWILSLLRPFWFLPKKYCFAAPRPISHHNRNLEEERSGNYVELVDNEGKKWKKYQITELRLINLPITSPSALLRFFFCSEHSYRIFFCAPSCFIFFFVSIFCSSCNNFSSETEWVREQNDVTKALIIHPFAFLPHSTKKTSSKGKEKNTCDFLISFHCTFQSHRAMDFAFIRSEVGGRT